MNETPLTILAKQIKVYESFISDLEKRKGIPINVTKEQIEVSKSKYKSKISEFEKAYEILSTELQSYCEHVPMLYGQLTVCSKCNKML